MFKRRNAVDTLLVACQSFVMAYKMLFSALKQKHVSVRKKDQIFLKILTKVQSVRQISDELSNFFNHRNIDLNWFVFAKVDFQLWLSNRLATVMF